MMPRLGAAEVPIGAAATVAARSQFEDLGAAALSQCAAQAIGATDIGAAAVGAAAVGAAAVGGAAYRRNCYDPYGNWICGY
jgi:hypothetical protein